MEQHLLEAVSDGVATLTLNRPERLNALSTPIMDGLLEALPRLARDSAVGAIVLTGAGRAFCAGGDVKGMATRAGTSEGRQRPSISQAIKRPKPGRRPSRIVKLATRSAGATGRSIVRHGCHPKSASTAELRHV